ncbi:Uncharacterised protein [Weissella viridescens]|uniref:Nucleoside 2-deoxyribosyltransferase n=1 Tax=Weissella viridescens TaxID=1629 RepID=A0A380P0J1_WEIVI|nr:Uncharacterised protein [Weissella viridescens]
MQVYLAAPFFSDEQISRVSILEQALEITQLSMIIIHHASIRQRMHHNFLQPGQLRFSSEMSHKFARQT